MTEDDKRKQLEEQYKSQGQSSSEPEMSAPDGASTGAAAPIPDQAVLEDQYGTGFINFGRYGKDTPEAQQFQPTPATNGALFDPTAPPPTTPPPVPITRGPTAPLPATDPMGTEQEGPIVKPFRRTRAALGYRGGEY